MKFIILLLIAGILYSEDDSLYFVLGYQSNAPAYVVISVNGGQGKCALGLKEFLQFSVSGDKIKQLQKYYEILSINDKKSFGKDIKIAISVKGKGSISYSDEINNNERIKTYKEIIKIIDIKIPSEYEMPEKLDDFNRKFLGLDGNVKAEVISKKLTWINDKKVEISAKVYYRSPGPGFARPQVFMVDENNVELFSASVVEEKEMDDGMYSISFGTSINNIKSIRFMMESNGKDPFIDIPLVNISDKK